MNGRDRNISQFRKLSAYIMQDNQLHGNLTVEEAMTVAANLKLSAKVSKSDKNVVVSMHANDKNWFSMIYTMLPLKTQFDSFNVNTLKWI